MATVTEHPVRPTPQNASAVGLRVFSIEVGRHIVGVMHSKKPAGKDGTLLIHISVSKSEWGEPLVVTPDDLRLVENTLLNAGLEWPDPLKVEPFTSGPFAGRGVNIWQCESD